MIDVECIAADRNRFCPETDGLLFFPLDGDRCMTVRTKVGESCAIILALSGDHRPADNEAAL